MISAQCLAAKGLEMDFSDFLDRDDLGFDDMPISMLFAGENETYWQTFPHVNFVSGRAPAPGTNEVMIDTRVQNAFNSLYREDLQLGDTILVAGANTNGVIREAVVVGIFDPPQKNSAMFQIIYCNPEFARSFADLTYGANFKQELPDSVDLELSSMDEDDLFGDDFFEEEFLCLDSCDSCYRLCFYPFCKVINYYQKKHFMS